MKLRLGQMLYRLLKVLSYSTLGAVVVVIIVFIVYLEGRADLDLWHQVDLDEEFSSNSAVTTFDQYLALEERLFRQLDALVYANVSTGTGNAINRYRQGGLADPKRWTPNWNRSFQLPAASPTAGVLLLHGMSDSPYSLRHLGQRLNDAGAYVVGLRLPGHGTAPAGLVEVSWQEMAAATRLAISHLAARVGDRPLYIVGYSTGAALAVQYALDTLDDPALARIDRLVLLSPAIGVTAVASLAVWQARIGHLLGLDKLAWNSILPEYDPFKYQSFAVNAGDLVYQLTREIQTRLERAGKRGALDRLPPILAFSSVVDATVSTPALVNGLFARLPEGEHELVLFDINRTQGMEALMKWKPSAVISALQQEAAAKFTLSLVSNESAKSHKVAVFHRTSAAEGVTVQPLDFAWPEGLYSLSHVALPFPVDDPLYGGDPEAAGTGLRLGDLALYGERGVLQIPASDMLRLRWNPFYPYVERRMLDYLGLN